MAVLLITFDSNGDVSRTDIARAIDYNWMWARLSDTSYAIETLMAPNEVYEKLAPLLDGDDKLLISTLGGPWWGQFPPDVLDWLKARL